MSEKTLLKTSAVIAALSGITILFGTLYPIASYERQSRERYPKLLSPLADSAKSGASFEKLDYTKASNWFAGTPEDEFKSNSVSFYTISVPKLGIKDASVAIGGEDLSESLIQYPGTANPGKIGNAVIFGHSILPQFYNPEDYMSIFSTLPSLEEGDVIKVSYDGVSYTYEVQDMFEVLPTELEVLDQNSNDPYLSLITCVPPGHPLKPRRLVVRAKIVPPDVAQK